MAGGAVPEGESRGQGAEEPAHSPGQFGIARKRCHLFLPQIEKPLGERGKVRRLAGALIVHGGAS